MLRATALYAYGFGCLLAVWFAFAGISALVEVSSRGTKVGMLEAIGFSFVPMLILMLAVFATQRRIERLVMPLILFVLAAAATLLPALVTHWAPGIGDPLGFAHLVIVGVGLAWCTVVLHGARQQ